MKILIIGAAGRIAQLATTDLLEQSDDEVVLYARHATRDLTATAAQYPGRVTLADGTFEDTAALDRAMDGVDAVFHSFVNGPDIVGPIVKLLDKHGIKRFVDLIIPDVYGEVEGPFQKWYRDNTGIIWTSPIRKTADLVESSDLDYALLRVTWLYDEPGNTRVHITRKGEPFREAQVTREAVGQLVADILTDKVDVHRDSIGVGEPGTEWKKPSFY